MVEPWLRGTLTEVDTVRRGVLHALELAREDVARWCGELTDEELEARPFGLPSVGFQMRHMVRSLDRLLTYAEGQQLSEEQLALLKSEMESGGRREDLVGEVERGGESAVERVRTIGAAGGWGGGGVGRKRAAASGGGVR